MMPVETPTFDALVDDVANRINDAWDILNEGISEPEHPCYSHAQQLDDKERVKRLRRQQNRKGWHSK